MYLRYNSHKRHNQYSFSNENNMCPLPNDFTYQSNILKLHNIEEMLTTKCNVIMSMYRLKSSGY